MTQKKQLTKSELITQKIEQRIHNGTWAPGSKLPPERELMEIFGVSRVSIRKALANLSGRGILRAIQGDGTYVNELFPSNYLDNALNMLVLSRTDYLDIQNFRLMMEPMIASRAAAEATPEDLKKLHDCLLAHNKAEAKGDLEEVLHQDIRFHNLLAQCLHNEIMNRVTSLTMDLTVKAIMDSGRYSRHPDGISDLENIYDLVARHDASGASSCMWYHIYKDFEALCKGYEAN